MLIRYELIYFILYICVNGHYIIYYSNNGEDSSKIFHCLYAYLIEGGKENRKPYIRNYHLIPYCRTIDQQQNEIKYSIGQNLITFKELKKQNISSQQLLQWFSPIDIAEKYEMNLNDSDLFYNCSSPWFSSYCQYKFNYSISFSFLILKIKKKE